MCISSETSSQESTNTSLYQEGDQIVMTRDTYHAKAGDVFTIDVVDQSDEIQPVRVVIGCAPKGYWPEASAFKVLPKMIEHNGYSLGAFVLPSAPMIADDLSAVVTDGDPYHPSFDGAQTLYHMGTATNTFVLAPVGRPSPRDPSLGYDVISVYTIKDRFVARFNMLDMNRMIDAVRAGLNDPSIKRFVIAFSIQGDIIAEFTGDTMLECLQWAHEYSLDIRVKLFAAMIGGGVVG